MLELRVETDLQTALPSEIGFNFNELKAELPDKWNYYIERLSEYIASKGAKYANHAVTIQKWAAEDNAKNEQNKLTTLTCKEGTSL